MSRKRVTLYTDNRNTSTIARNYLLGRKIEFEEVDTTKPEGYEKLIKSTRQKITPCLEVRASHRRSTSSGFDEFLYAVALDPTLSYNEFLTLKQKEHEESKNKVRSDEESNRI
jgi:hypothetical protein